jgi:hypothetical protein
MKDRKTVGVLNAHSKQKGGTQERTATITTLAETLSVPGKSTSTFATLPVQLDQSCHDDRRGHDA